MKFWCKLEWKESAKYFKSSIISNNIIITATSQLCGHPNYSIKFPSHMYEDSRLVLLYFTSRTGARQNGRHLAYSNDIIKRVPVVFNFVISRTSVGGQILLVLTVVLLNI